MRASLYRAILTGVAVTLGLTACGGAPERPSVLLILVEGVRADHCSAYGYTRPTTPGLEAVAHEGVLFERAYSSTPYTPAAVASLLSGRYPPEHGMLLRGDLDEAVPTLGEILSDSGYETHAVISDPLLPAAFGLLRGFHKVDLVDPTDTAEADGGAAEVTRRARAWLEDGRDASRPFFMMIVYSSPRLPFAPPEPYPGRFLSGGELPDSVEAATRLWMPFARRFNAGDVEMSARDRATLTSLYDAEIAYADSQVRELVGAMRELALLDETLLVVTSDRGEDLGDGHRLADRTSLGEGNLRVPLLMRHPGLLPGGEREAAPAQDVDLLPTVVGLLGLERPETVSTTAVGHLGEGEGGPGRKGAVSVSIRRLPDGILHLVMSATDGRYRYTLTPMGPESLVDLESADDPPTNLLEEGGEPFERLHGVLMEWDSSLRPIPAADPPGLRSGTGEAGAE